MRAHLLILQLTNDAVRFNETEELAWAQTNFPKVAVSFRTGEPVRWLVEVLRYEAQTGKLEVEVIDYEPEAEDLPDFAGQTMKRPVNELAFAPLDKEELRNQLSYVDPAGLAAILRPEIVAEIPDELALDLSQVPENLPEPEEREITFVVPFGELEFGLGKVQGETTIEPFPEPVPFYIENDYLIADFDHIKGYFAKLLKRKSAEVTARLRIHGDAVALDQARSPQIAAINQEMLQLARRRRLRVMLKPSFEPELDQYLFTANDFFGNLSSEELGNKLTQDGADALLKELFAIRKVRNQKQLAWLAGHLQAAHEPIRYTLRPQFGFLFFFRGEGGHHFIWELLNSHATYLWTFDGKADPPTNHYPVVEREVAKIDQYGQMLYRRTDLDRFTFNTVRHPGANSKRVDDFPRWRNKLSELLI